MTYEGFTREIDKLTGINLDFYKENQMKRRINFLMKKNNYSNYLNYLNAMIECTSIYEEFIDYLTINVSEFYRSHDQYEILENEVIPQILNSVEYPKVWSSACSTGEEPYTLVMVLNKFISLENIKIIASDIDTKAINKAKSGVYKKKNIDKLPAASVSKFFDNKNDSFYIKEEIKNCVEFRHIDLLKDEYPAKCDLIVCRNVLIYLTAEAKSEIYKKLSRSLKNNGILFVGNTEQIISCEKFNLEQFKTFFYIKKES